MGWVSYHVDTDIKNGKLFFDRKKECDEVLNRGIGKEHKILKSAMVGSTYYAAVQTPKSDEAYEIWAAIFLTSFDRSLTDNFAYKDMDETMGPSTPYCKCPVSILKLLTETTNEVAIEWRKKCWDYHKNLKIKSRLNRLPLGSRITFINKREFQGNVIHPGQRIYLTKCQGRNGKRMYWTDGMYRWRIAYIPSDYELIAQKETTK